jgi:hypothetical protein
VKRRNIQQSEDNEIQIETAIGSAKGGVSLVDLKSAGSKALLAMQGVKDPSIKTF